ncbi:MAG: class I SAM-dependent methyltransferase [Planctomycetota bacterium]
MKSVKDRIWNSTDLVSRDCDLCGSEEQVHLYTRPDGLHAVECVSCGLCYLNPMPRQESIGKLYAAGYHDLTADRNRVARTGMENHLEDDHVREILKHKRKRAEMLLSHADLAGKRCLEVGCATGEFCSVLGELGAVPLGIDLGEDAVETARKRYPRIEFLSSDIESLPGEEIYDLVLAFEVIEHLLSPDRFFKEARIKLKPGGLLVISTPNYACAKRLGPENWVGLNEILEHIFFLSFSTAEKYGEKHRMEPIAWYSKGGAGKVRKGMKRIARDLLHRFDMGKRLRSAKNVVMQEQVFRRNTENHDLYMIFTKLE